MLQCSHSWGGHACDHQVFGLLCYTHRDQDGNDVLCIELSCERFAQYHCHHGGIAILIALKVNSREEYLLRRELSAQRELFKDEFAAQCIEGPQKEALVVSAMEKFDAFVAAL